MWISRFLDAVQHRQFRWHHGDSIFGRHCSGMPLWFQVAEKLWSLGPIVSFLLCDLLNFMNFVLTLLISDCASEFFSTRFHFARLLSYDIFLITFRCQQCIKNETFDVCKGKKCFLKLELRLCYVSDKNCLDQQSALSCFDHIFKKHPSVLILPSPRKLIAETDCHVPSIFIIYLSKDQHCSLNL